MSASKISYTDFGGPSQVRAASSLLSHRHLFRFLFRCDLTASFLLHARKKISFPKIPTRRTLSVINVTSFVFIFSMSDIRNADTFDRVFRRPAFATAILAYLSPQAASSLPGAQVLLPARATVPPWPHAGSSRASRLPACCALDPRASAAPCSCHHEACNARSAWPQPGKACPSV
jgi:hypothetical protein